MLWLYILLGILLFLALIMVIPITVKASYYEDFRCCIFIGFVKLTLYPPKPKKEKRKKKSEKNTEKKDKKEPEKEESNIIKEKGLPWLIELIKKIAKLAGSVLNDFFKHIIIKKLLLSIKLVGSDAADTAIKFGQCCAAVYPAISIITSTMKCNAYGVDIMPDFDKNAKTQIEFELVAVVYAFRLFELVFRHGIKAIKLLAQLKQ